MTVAMPQAFGLGQKNINLNPLIPNYDLSIGEPKISPFPTDILLELTDKKNIHYYYPSHGDLALREMIIESYYNDMKVENIAITHGTMGALDFIFRANLDQETEILLPNPGFPPYCKLSEFTKTKIKYYLLDLSNDSETLIDWDQLESLITSKPTILLLNSPHNPTGKILTELDMKNFERILSEYPNVSFLMDEVYRGLIYGNKRHFNFSQYIDRGYIVGSFSKIFPLQGARIGWILTNQMNMKKLSTYFNNATGAMSSFGQEIVKSLLKRKLNFKEHYWSALNQAMDLLNDFGVNYVKPDGAFFIFIKYEVPLEEAINELAGLGVQVVSGVHFGSLSGNYIRVSFAQPADHLKKAFTIIGEHWKKRHQRLYS